MFSSTVKKFGSFETIDKQIRFATAVALTKTAKQAQTAAIGTIKSNFTIRNNWVEPQNKLGVRITPAKKDNLQADVKTNAEFLKKFETGADKLPRGKRLAIPTANVRRNKKDIIPRSMRPSALRDKRTFVVNTKSGPVLFQRKFKGKRSQIVALYNLEPKAKIKRRPSFYMPIERVARANFNRNFDEAVKNAFATAK